MYNKLRMAKDRKHTGELRSDYNIIKMSLAVLHGIAFYKGSMKYKLKRSHYSAKQNTNHTFQIQQCKL